MSAMSQMEEEMKRFEAELNNITPIKAVIASNTYNNVASQLKHNYPVAPVTAAPVSYQQVPPAMSYMTSQITGMMVPHQVSRPNTSYVAPTQINAPYIPMNNITPPAPAHVSKAKGVSTAAEVAISQGKASANISKGNSDEFQFKSKGKKSKKVVRIAGGQTWEDSSLLEWDEDDFRIFCGDLGNDVTDNMLEKAFSKYPSFQKAKVIRDKRTQKSKGFGFVSLKDPQDFIRAMKEMNGKYVGTRPIKLKKSSWKQRNAESVRQKEAEKQKLVKLMT